MRKEDDRVIYSQHDRKHHPSLPESERVYEALARADALMEDAGRNHDRLLEATDAAIADQEERRAQAILAGSISVHSTFANRIYHVCEAEYAARLVADLLDQTSQT